ncbi:hypothetical protein QJS83_04755 [Bdellovibrio sp. 22V]|uniref:hypothetical protein n=1 Tax=Bdellovibrio TaxID=958 RepID=UPI0025429446|nr:hypothetical protein [Bdellovibrio sp. 22V]WII73181.1 hypothetical protein QJS83_04755 [Bdellovibrio sp. 22V]
MRGVFLALALVLTGYFVDFFKNRIRRKYFDATEGEKTEVAPSVKQIFGDEGLYE